MTVFVSAALALALAQLTPAPLAGEPSPPRVSLGARAGLALPSGELERGLASGDVTSRIFPLELRAGWRFTPELELGLQGGWAPANVGGGRRGDCVDDGVSCAVHRWTVAARGEYARRGMDWAAWGALTLGWERQVERWEQAADNWEQKAYDGWLAGVEAGVDRPVKRYFDLGLFIGYSLGQHAWVSLKGAAPGFAAYDDSGWVPSPALHGWLSIGLRGTFAL